MSERKIGTLIRCADITEQRLAFFREIGLNAIQLGGVYEAHLASTPEARSATDGLFELFERYGISVPSLFLGYTGQDWKSPERTVGLVPEAFRAERLLLSCRQMLWASSHGIRYIACHVGFVPQLKDLAYERFIAEMKQLAKFAGSLGQTLLFETGTESVSELKTIFSDIDEPALGINFDPANLLYYNQDDPAVLLDEMSDFIKVVHCKDAVRPLSGQKYGSETVLGQGGTNFTALLKRLQAVGFDGPLIIERELAPGPEQEKDISEAVKLIYSTLQQ